MIDHRTNQEDCKESAIALLHVDYSDFLFQLRDFKSTISYPGHWAGFGGEIENEETPEHACLRELQEELGYVPDSIKFFRDYFFGKTAGLVEQRAHLYIYYGPLTVPLSQLNLTEGLDFDLFNRQEILGGRLYSEKIKNFFPIPELLVRVFEDFFEFIANDHKSLAGPAK